MARNREGTSVHIAGVTGSSPVPPTNISAKNQPKDTGDAGCGATKDILQEIGTMYHPYWPDDCVLCRAAEEIERLREQKKEANAAARRFP